MVGVGSSVSPCSYGRTGSADDEEALGFGSILHHSGSGCSHNEFYCNIRSDLGQDVGACLVSMVHSDCHNSYCDEIERQSYCVEKL